MSLNILADTNLSTHTVSTVLKHLINTLTPFNITVVCSETAAQNLIPEVVLETIVHTKCVYLEA